MTDRKEQWADRFISSRLVDAKPMSLGDYNTHRGWQILPDEDPNRAGYLTRDMDGHETWVPANIFIQSYRSTDGMNFGLALEAMRLGLRVTRRGWPPGTFVVIMPHLNLPAHSSQEPGAKVNDRTAKYIGEDTPLNCLPYFAFYSSQGNLWQPGWVPTQADMLLDDWTAMDEE